MPVRKAGAGESRDSLGKFGPQREQHCRECCGEHFTGPHQASLQVTDAVLKRYLVDDCQVEEDKIFAHIQEFKSKCKTGNCRTPM
jgi:hypothetical protein